MNKTTKKIHLLAIDCQEDFCNSTMGSLYVPGAEDDMRRLSDMINRLSGTIDKIHVTLDSHRVVQVFHPVFWCNSEGFEPPPFTIITTEDVENGKWMTKNPSWRQRGIDYVKKLASKGKFPLCIWPYHTIIGSQGHSLVLSVSDALIRWEKHNFAMVDYCMKGDYYFSEAYGALESEVPVPEEPSTQLNTKLINSLQEADEILIGGEALSHCVKNTIEQIAVAFGEDNIKKLVLLTDCTSNVTGYSDLGDYFIKDMVARGMRTTTSIDYLATLSY